MSNIKLNKTKLETEIQKKKELGEAEEYIKQVDKGEEGRKYTIDLLKEDEKKDKKLQDSIKTDLETKKHQHFSYRRSLADYGNWLLEEIKEKEWEMEYVPTDGSRLNVYGKWFDSKEGIQLIVKAPNGNVFLRGVKTSYIPEWDEHAIRVLYIQAENTIDSYKGLLLSDKPKIITK